MTQILSHSSTIWIECVKKTEIGKRDKEKRKKIKKETYTYNRRGVWYSVGNYVFKIANNMCEIVFNFLL